MEHIHVWALVASDGKYSSEVGCRVQAGEHPVEVMQREVFSDSARQLKRHFASP